MIPSQRARFDIPREVAYLNCAYMSPLMHSVVAAGSAGLSRKARPWQIVAPDFFDGPETARALFARIVGSTPEAVAVLPSASYGLAVAAANVPLTAGKRVIVAADQFPSNRHVWAKSASAAQAALVAVDGPDLTEAFLAAIDANTKIVACAQCRWTDGALIDLVRVSKACKAVGAALVLDLTQSAGVLPVDLGAIDPDFAVAASYKWLLGPYSLAFMHVAARHRAGRPLEEGWMNRDGAEDFARLIDYTEAYRPGARRYDMGEVANFSALPAANAAMRQVLDWGVAEIAKTLTQRTAEIAERADALGLHEAASGPRAGHFLGLTRKEGLPSGLPERLARTHVYVSQRGDSLRITPHLWVDDADVDRLFAALSTQL
ncbi:MAG: aminotransferase class V-fold PLP-dependent enzyme [Pseudomonadota bacterium]